MSEIFLYVRSFHPLSNFGAGGLGYRGDTRGFSFETDRNRVTSRIIAVARIDLETAAVTPFLIDSDPSHGLTGFLSDDISDPAHMPHFTMFSGIVDPYREDGDQSAQVMMAYTGQNFAQLLASVDLVREIVWRNVVPGLDVTTSLNIEIDRDDGEMSVTLRMVGDGFPNAEAFLIDAAEEPLMLATHRRVGSAIHQLRDNRRIAMCSTGLEVAFPDDKLGSALEPFWCLDYATFTGTQIDVMEDTGRAPADRAGWNALHTTHRDAEGGWGRYVAGDTAWTFVPGRPGSSMP